MQVIDEPVERHILMRVRAQARPPYPLKKLLEGRVLARIDPHHELVREEAN